MASYPRQATASDPLLGYGSRGREGLFRPASYGALTAYSHDDFALYSSSDENEHYSEILTRFNARPATANLEPEALPALSKGKALAEDGNLRYNKVASDAEEAGKSPEFLGGITKRQFWLVFIGILTTNFIAAFDGTVMASTHASITSSFQSSNSASWLSTSFLLTSTSFQPLFGRLSDILGRRIPFIFGLVVFTVSTVWCALAGSMESLIAARALCGVGAGVMLSMGAIVLSDMIPMERRPAYQSVNNIGFGLGSSLGVACGGAIADALGWRWEFGIQVPPALLCIAICYYNIPDSSFTDHSSPMQLLSKLKDFDFFGSLFLTLSVGLLVLGLNTGGNIFPWDHWLVVTSLVAGGIFTLIFVYAEKRAKYPIIPLNIISQSPRSNLIFGNFFALIAQNGVLFNIPLYFQTVLYDSATAAGSRLLLPTLALMTTSVSAGLIITALGTVRPTLVSGATVLFLGTVPLLTLSTTTPAWLASALLLPSHFGQGLAFPSTLMGVLAASSAPEMAVSTSSLIMMRSLGSILGVSTSSLIVQNALIYALETHVTGPEAEKRAIIDKVRKSVHAIFDLEGRYKAQVSAAYGVALRWAFAWSVCMAAAFLLCVWRVDVPSIRRKTQGQGKGGVGK